MNVFCIVLMNGYYVPCTIMPNKYRIVSYFMIGPEKIYDAINLGSTSLLLNNISNYGKMDQTCLTFMTLKMTF